MYVKLFLKLFRKCFNTYIILRFPQKHFNGKFFTSVDWLKPQKLKITDYLSLCSLYGMISFTQRGLTPQFAASQLKGR